MKAKTSENVIEPSGSTPPSAPHADRQALAYRLLAFWKEQLGLLDLAVELTFKPLEAYATTEAASDGEDTNKAKIEISTSTLGLSDAFLSETICHELIHVLLWPTQYALKGEALLSKAQRELADDLLLLGIEASTYRLERILTRLVRLPKELTDSSSSFEVNMTHKKTRRTAH